MDFKLKEKNLVEDDAGEDIQRNEPSSSTNNNLPQMEDRTRNRSHIPNASSNGNVGPFDPNITPSHLVFQPNTSMPYAVPMPLLMMPMPPPVMMPQPYPVGYLPALPQGPQMVWGPPVVPQPQGIIPPPVIPPYPRYTPVHKRITILVQAPRSTTTAKWRLNGQIIPITLNLTDCIADLKEKIEVETGMPPDYQNIFHEGVFCEDIDTVIDSNLRNGSLVHLVFKLSK